MGDIKLRDIYSWEERLQAENATTITKDGKPVLRGQIVRIETFIAQDETTDSKIISLGYGKGATRHWLIIQTASVTVGLTFLMIPLILVEGEYPCARIATPTANDYINIIARGVYL